MSFFFFYLKEILLSNLRVAYDVLTPRHRMKPGIIAVDVGDMTEWQIFFMSNLITMTPGTLGLTVSRDQRILYIHAMYIDGSAGELAQSLRANYGRRIKRVF
ncbi:MAG: Na+/H+ antiporter subunit E [Puniceicoccaceae bacterium]